MPVALTVDVEDWYDGMEELGHRIERPDNPRSGLDNLLELLSVEGGYHRLTLFVVGNYARRVRPQLEALCGAGHEIASHGPDHGAVPDSAAELEEWLRRGKETLEDLLQVWVSGFRSPRFDVPKGMELGEYRDCIARAGFEYVSDRHRVGSESPVWELPVLSRWGLPLGGGSYQRLLPQGVLRRLLPPSPRLAVLYYHSYDFGATLPSPMTHRSSAVLKQVLGRDRIPTLFRELLRSVGSVSCRDASYVV
jgi:peptidoglycan/xylan/chitin deacetylase (PgdA/CDA1 family)